MAAPIAACHEPVQRGLRELCHHAINGFGSSGMIYVTDMALANLRTTRVVVWVAAVDAVSVAAALVIRFGVSDPSSRPIIADASTSGDTTAGRTGTLVFMRPARLVDGRHPVVTLWQVAPTLYAFAIAKLAAEIELGTAQHLQHEVS